MCNPFGCPIQSSTCQASFISFLICKKPVKGSTFGSAGYPNSDVNQECAIHGNTSYAVELAF